jgi:hypothetical protein
MSVSLVGRLCLTFALSVAAAPLAAQSDSTRMPTFYVGGGVSQFDLSGTGTAPLFVANAAWELRRVFLLEAGTSVARLDQDVGTTTLLIPGGQVQAQGRIGNLRPYIGLGAGVALDVRDEAYGGWNTEPAVSASAGLRLWFKRWLALRAELRLQGIGTGFEGAVAEWHAGLTGRMK